MYELKMELQPKKLGYFFRLTFPFDLPNSQTLKACYLGLEQHIEKILGSQGRWRIDFSLSDKAWLTLKM